MPPQDCFHCGLPLPQGPAFGFAAPGEWRRFCCAGCEAVARVIAGQGLDDYYRVRSAAPARPAKHMAAADLRLYDDATLQARFVREASGGAREAELIVEGIRCAACAWLIEQVVSRVPGVESVEVNAVTRHARLRWHPDRVALSAVFEEL